MVERLWEVLEGSGRLEGLKEWRDRRFDSWKGGMESTGRLTGGRKTLVGSGRIWKAGGTKI